MKKVLCWMLVCLVCLAPVLATAVSYFPWLTTVLGLEWADEADTQQDWTVADGMRVVQLHFVAGEDTVATEDVNANTDMFSLKDADGEKYLASVVQMSGVKFDAEAGTFSTDETQTAFDLFFAIPEDVELSTMDLLVKTENEKETIVVHLSDVGARPEEEAATTE